MNTWTTCRPRSSTATSKSRPSSSCRPCSKSWRERRLVADPQSAEPASLDARAGSKKGTICFLSDEGLVDRLAAHRLLASVPRAELEWLAAHGTLRRVPAGAVVSDTTRPIDGLWVIFSGVVAIMVDRGS